MKNKLLTSMLLLVSSAVFSSSAFAHGSVAPKQGGVVKIEHEMAFELVREKAGTSLYLRDHGKPYSTAKISGSLTILAKGEKSTSILTPTKGNKMVSDVIIPDGAKVLVKVKEEGHHLVVVRYVF